MSEFQDFRFPLNFQEMKVSAGGAADQIDFGPVPPGHLWLITNVAFINDDNNTDRVRISIAGFGELHHLAEVNDPSDQRVYYVNGSFYIPEGRYLRVRWVGSVSTDVLHAYVQGFDVIQPKDAPHA